MPELPDVETFRRYLEATSLHKKIEYLQLRETDILEKTSAGQLTKGLRGREFTSAGRHGKYLFAHTDADATLVLHFGMSGGLQYFKRAGDAPEYTYLQFDFANGYHLAYTMVRKLGLIRLITDLGGFLKEKQLGPDVRADDFDLNRFAACLRGRRGMIKPALMNQKIMAGLGNVYADEVLFQAGVHPETSVDELDTGDLKGIYRSMNHVLSVAIDRQADPGRFPDSWIIPQRGKKGATCPRCGGEIKKITVSGRTTYFCPKRQSQ
jgi:formamidopyrimidine-DNA glycosylase